jgi:hypothetical protein
MFVFVYGHMEELRGHGRSTSSVGPSAVRSHGSKRAKPKRHPQASQSSHPTLITNPFGVVTVAHC